MISWQFLIGVAGQAAFHPVTLPEAPREASAQLPRGLPSGQLSAGGVPFQVHSPRQLTGIHDAHQGQLHPTEIPGIAVNQKAAVLHVLHGIEGTEKDGVPLWSLVLHYADGQEESVRFAYGLQSRSLSSLRHESSRLYDPNSSVAWQTTNRMGNRFVTTLRVYHSVIANPRPGDKIVSVDLVSLFSRATPVIMALTTEDAPAQTRILEARSSRVSRLANEFDDDVYRAKLLIHAQDADRKPVAGAEATLTISDLDGTYFFGRGQADAQGLVRLAIPRQHAAGLTILVRAKNCIPFVYDSPKNAAGRQPSDVVATLSAGSAAGGLVRSAAGEPIPDARVTIYYLKQNSTREYSRLDYDTVATDASGHWQTTALPASLDGFQFAVAHPDFRPRLYAMNTASRPNGSPVSVWSADDLRARNVAAELTPALLLLGTVRTEGGQAVSGAEVRFSMARNGPEATDDELIVRSDASGRFKIPVLTSGVGNVVVLAEGYAPEVQTVSLRDASGPNPTLQMTLKAGRRFVGHVADQSQQPIAGAKARLESWNDTRLLKFEVETDDKGDFVWTNAPEGQLRFYLTATNHSSTTYSISGNTPEYRFTLRKIPSVRGRVIDAETRQPIADFSVYRGRSYNYGEPMRWERYNTFRGRNGEYNIRLVDYGSSVRTAVLVEAPGYMPAASQPFNKPGLYTNNFELKKARGITGVVTAEDGNPLPGVLVALLEPSEQAYLRVNGDLSRSSDSGVQAKTDTEGRFSFAPRLDPHTIIATGSRGFAEVRLTNVLQPVTIKLQPWAHVTGRVAISPPPDRPHSVRLGNTFYRYADESRESEPLSLYLNAQTNPDGTFRFDRVPPGERRVSIEYTVRVGENSTRSVNSHGIAMVLAPGQSTNVVLGENGRTIIGRMNVVGAEPEDVDWKRDFHTMSPIRTLNMNLPQLDFSKARTAEQQQELWAQQRKAENAFWRTPAGRDYERGQISYALQFETNGTFRVEGVPPGSYTLQISPTDPSRDDYSYEQIGSFSRQVEVTAAPRGKPNEPIDLGALEIAVRGTMRMGKKAPRFTLKSRSGEDIKLDAYRGKYVLIDFWATWSGSRSFDLRQLTTLHNRYAKDPRLVMIGINLDHSPQMAEQELEKNPVPWTQCLGGTWNDSPLRVMFGLRSLPENVFIDPDGKIAGFNLRGANILRVVERALGEPKN